MHEQGWYSGRDPCFSPILCPPLRPKLTANMPVAHTIRLAGRPVALLRGNTSPPPRAPKPPVFVENIPLPDTPSVPYSAALPRACRVYRPDLRPLMLSASEVGLVGLRNRERGKSCRRRSSGATCLNARGVPVTFPPASPRADAGAILTTSAAQDTAECGVFARDIASFLSPASPKNETGLAPLPVSRIALSARAGLFRRRSGQGRESARVRRCAAGVFIRRVHPYKKHRAHTLTVPE